MPGIGETLRQARMRQRLDIADVEERTKIRAKYLRALENEEFSLLPGPTYVRTFLRTYAEFLGLDARRLVEQYREEWEPETAVAEPRSPLAPAPEPGRRPFASPPRGPRPLAIAAIVFAVLLAVLFVLGLTSEEQGGKGSGASTTADKFSAQPRSPARTTSEGRNPRRRARATVVVIEPAVPTYVCVDRGAGTAVAYEGIASSPLRFTGERIRLNLGKTSVRVVVAGRPVTIAPGPNPVGYDVVGGRVRPLPPSERPCVARPSPSNTPATGSSGPASGAQAQPQTSATTTP